MSLPTIDLSSFTTGGDQRRSTADGIFKSLQAHGFVKIQGHGISEEDVRHLFAQGHDFFHLPNETKRSIAHPAGPKPQRGWSKIGAENSSTLYQKGLLGKDAPVDLTDAREHFDMGAPSDEEFPNRFLDDETFPEYRATMESTFKRMESVCASILEALEVAMDLPIGSFNQRCTAERSASEFRINHYPSIPMEVIESGRVGRIWPHFDLGVITLLFQDSVGGLEFENRAQPGSFSPVETGPRRSDIVVNISETMQRWTNDQLRAGLHRVALPQGFSKETTEMLPERYSIAYFCKADREASVGPLPQFLKATESRYDDISALEYHKRRLQSAYN